MSYRKAVFVYQNKGKFLHAFFPYLNLNIYFLDKVIHITSELVEGRTTGDTEGDTEGDTDQTTPRERLKFSVIGEMDDGDNNLDISMQGKKWDVQMG